MMQAKLLDETFATGDELELQQAIDLYGKESCDFL